MVANFLANETSDAEKMALLDGVNPEQFSHVKNVLDRCIANADAKLTRLREEAEQSTKHLPTQDYQRLKAAVAYKGEERDRLKQQLDRMRFHRQVLENPQIFSRDLRAEVPGFVSGMAAMFPGGKLPVAQDENLSDARRAVLMEFLQTIPLAKLESWSNKSPTLKNLVEAERERRKTEANGSTLEAARTVSFAAKEHAAELKRQQASKPATPPKPGVSNPTALAEWEWDNGGVNRSQWISKAVYIGARKYQIRQDQRYSGR